MAKAAPLEMVSRREAANLLGCNPVTVERIAERNGLRFRQIPGHKRKFFYRSELENLLAQAEHVATGARA
jgi:excisionase family DNA binding protein